MRPQFAALRHLMLTAGPAQARSFAATHSIHALAVVVPVAVIVLALYWDRIGTARKRWSEGRPARRRRR